MLDIFDTGELGQYFYDDFGEVWVHGGMLVTRLGFKNISQAINMYTEPCERLKPENLMGYINVPWFVNESGVWNLVLKSRTKECVDFKRKLCSEILPAIRKNGGYISDSASLDQLTKLLQDTEAKVESMTNDLALAELKVSQMSEYIQGETDRTQKAKESVTEEAIKESVVEYKCVTDDTNGDALVFQTYAKPELAKVRLELERSNLERKNSNKMLQTIYGKVSASKNDTARLIKGILDKSDQKFLQPS